MNSAIYRGWVRHRRTHPVPNSFTYSVYMLWLNLDEVQSIFSGRWLWSATRPAVGWFREADYLNDFGSKATSDLRRRVESVIQSRGFKRPQGPIGLLTNLRCFGYCMNPVSFYYCFAAEGDEVQSIVAEITNTPWRERHCYVLDHSENLDARIGRHEHRFRKSFHVSPFMGMDQEYHWRMSAPSERLSVHMETMEQGRRIFDATMVLQRRELSTINLLRCLMRHPMMSAEVAARIYWQAAKLRVKGVPFVPHPRHLREAAT